MYLPISRLAINTKKHFMYKKTKLIKQNSIKITIGTDQIHLKHLKTNKSSKIIFGKIPNSWHIDTQLRHPQMKYSGLGVALCVRFFQF
ncbi:MAG: hypothetical protein DI594_19030 [Shewanella oneidensis]|nr:MAG: hypothetical protein DI594_19030 [Shewanella oneidensis]